MRSAPRQSPTQLSETPSTKLVSSLLSTISMASTINLNFYENFIESIALVMSKALTDDETEKVLSSFQSLQARLRVLSSENLRRLESEARVLRPFCKHKGTCTGNCLRGFIKAFLVIYAIKYGLSFIPQLITGQIYKKPSTLLKIGGKDTISFAMFLSIFISGYKGVLCGMRRIRGKSDSLNPFIAGCVAGTSLFLDTNHSRRLMVALYLTTRTMHFVCRWIWQRHIERIVFGLNSNVPLMEDLEASTVGKSNGARYNTTKNSHGTAEQAQPLSGKNNHELVSKIKRVRRTVRYTAGTLVMMLSSSQILYSYVCEPTTLAKSYMSFLLTHGGVRALQPERAKDYLEVMGECIKACSEAPTMRYMPLIENPDLPPPLFESSIPKGLPVKRILPYEDFINQVPHDFVLCSFQHPFTTDCAPGVIRAFIGEWWRSLALYAPLNGVMTLIFRGKDVLRHPRKVIYHFIQSTLRSCLFLTAYVTTSWCAPCYMRTWAGKDQIWMYYLNGIMAGAMVLIEAPGRRLELGLYCLPRAVESLWNMGVMKGWWRHIPAGEAIYFCLATGVLMTLYDKDPASIHDGCVFDSVSWDLIVRQLP